MNQNIIKNKASEEIDTLKLKIKDLEKATYLTSLAKRHILTTGEVYYILDENLFRQIQYFSKQDKK